MQLGYVSAILPDASLDDVFAAAADHGYDCVELMCWPTGSADRRYAGVTHIDAARLDDAAAARIRDLTERTGVSIAGLGYYPNPLDPDKQAAAPIIEHMHRVIDASAKLGVNIFNTFVGRDWQRSIDDNWPRFREVWPAIVEHAEQAGVKIGLENCPMLFSQDEWPGGKNLATTPAVWRRIFNDLPSPNLGLNYDPSHLVWQMIDPIQPLHEFAERLVHVHAKDTYVDHAKLNDVGILALPTDYHDAKLPGRGDLDWAAFCQALRTVGYAGPVCVEVEDRDYEGSLEARHNALRESAEHLRPFIENTK